MATFPTIAQIVGQHGAIYEAYYRQADPNNTGSIGAFDAANFLKKSGLKETILSQVWDLSDPTGKGYLEKSGFFVALKMISLAQNGQELGLAKLTVETPQPNLGPVEIPPPPSETDAVLAIPWTVTITEKAKYDQVFDSLHPVNNLLGGDKVRPVLLNSKLPMEILGRIWDLSDLDTDGYLDREEFALAMHLVHKALSKEPLPPSLSVNMIPPSKRKPGPGAVPVVGPMIAGRVGPASGRSTPVTYRAESPALRKEEPVGTPFEIPAEIPWVVTPADKMNYDVMFRKADLDMDGYVSGQEIRDIFLQSGLQNNVLAHIWNLCDMKGIGKLTSEQFALAMHLVKQKVNGIDPPPSLTPDMVPPTMRPGVVLGAVPDTAAFGVADGNTSVGPYGHVADFSAIKELDSIQKEIDDIKREKLKLEADQQQQQADIRICQGEVQSLEKELSNITSALQQLENQKKDAQKCLDELEEKKVDLETSVREIKQKCDEERKQIEALNAQIQNQAKSAMEQDEELNRLRIELGQLREEENSLEQKVETGKTQMEQLNKSHKDLLLQVNQTKTRVQHLQDQYRAVQSGISQLTTDSDSGGGLSATPTSFDEQFSTRATQGSPVSTISDFSMGSAAGLDDDPFKSKDPFGGSGGIQADPFAADDPFKKPISGSSTPQKDDPFKSSEGFTSDPFGSDDPFKDAFSSSSNSTSFKEDPFSSADPFGSSFTSSTSSSNKKSDGFDPFGTAFSTPSSKSQKSSADLFGSDPFAPSHAKGRPESPRPALPPKQKKAPPPRPAPPKGRSPAGSPSKPSKPDPFGSSFPNDPFGSSDPFAGSSSGVGGEVDAFSNFADFSKNSNSFGDDSWAFTSPPASTPSSKKSSTKRSGSKKKSKSSSKSNNSKPLSKEEQEEADFQLALKLSRGEVDDSFA